jgi:predicted esterase
MIEEAHIRVTRTARYYTVGADAHSPRELWFACHGYGQLARYFARHFESLADGVRTVVVPEGLSRFYFGDPRGHHGSDSMVGATWMTREDRDQEIEDHVRYLDTLYAHIRAHRGRARARVTVLGFSQGVATVCRWLANGTARADRIILWGGKIPTDIFPIAPSSPLRAAALTLVVGTGDEYLTPLIVAEQESRLRSEKLAYDIRRFDGGHTVDEATLREIAACG